MAGVVELRGLLDAALGQPERGVVDFKLLKEFLIQILIVTRPVGGSLNPKVDNTSAESEGTRESGFGGREDPRSDESLMYGDHFEKDLKSFREKQDEIIKRLAKIENNGAKFASFDSLPSGEELLSKTRGMLEGSSNENDKTEMEVANVDDEVEKSTSSHLQPSEPGKEKFLNNSWNNVRVNKRLQALEDGVDKLFAMLDILTNEQKRMKGAYKNDRESDTAQENKKLINDVTELRSKLDGMSRFEDEVAAVKKRLGTVEETLEGLRNMNKSLDNGDVLSDLEKRLRNIEAGRSKPDYSGLEKELAALKGSMNELTRREELEDYVKWSALEDALDLKGYMKRTANDVDKGEVAAEEQVNEGESNRLGSGEGVKERSDAEIHKKGQGSHLGENEEVDGGKVQTPGMAKREIEDQSIEPRSGRNSKERYPSAELRDCLKTLSEMASKFNDIESKIESMKHVEPVKEKDGLEDELNALKEQVLKTNQVAECNKSLIDSTRADVDRLLANTGNEVDDVDENLNAIKEHLIELDERETKTSTGLANMNASVYKELKAKQQLIDALYECVEQLQRSKADIGNATSIFDLEAYKKALDTKVSMNDFDQMILGLQKNIEDLLQRLDRYANEEESLREALEKLNDSMRDKLDATAEESLKKYLESRISQLQKSRENLMSEAGQHIITKAAGFRRPLSTLFHCISCDRPVHLDGTGKAISSHYRKFKGQQYKSQDASSNDPHSTKDRKQYLDTWRDPFSVTRACGGNHTSIVHTPKKGMKPPLFTKAEVGHLSRSFIDQRKRENTIVDLLLGTDGNVYRGRYKLTDLPYQKENNFSTRRGLLRTRSAEARRPPTVDYQHSNGNFSNPDSQRSIVSLPPLDKETFAPSTPPVPFRLQRREAKQKNGENETRD